MIINDEFGYYQLSRLYIKITETRTQKYKEENNTRIKKQKIFTKVIKPIVSWKMESDKRSQCYYGTKYNL